MTKMFQRKKNKTESSPSEETRAKPGDTSITCSKYGVVKWNELRLPLLKCVRNLRSARQHCSYMLRVATVLCWCAACCYSALLMCCVLLQCFVDMLRVATVFCWYGACCYSALLMCCVLLQYFVDVLRVATVLCWCAACCYSVLFMCCMLLQCFVHVLRVVVMLY